LDKYYILDNPVFRKETLPGTEIEYRVVRELKNLFSEYSDWIKIVDIPTDTWIEEECYIEINNTHIKCHALPYVNKTMVEGQLIVLNNPWKIKKTICDNNDCIALIEFPIEIDLAKYIVLELFSRGFNATIFYDRYPNRYRRVVLTGSRDYSFNNGSPPPIPAVSIRKEDSVIIKKELGNGNGRVLININARTIHDVIGKNVLIGINGSGEKEYHITAHHDHWFTGFSDNLVGLATLYKVVNRLHGEPRVLPNIVLISFTSEEIGAPYYTSWYWIWGSRYYLDVLEEKSDLERIYLNINVDTLYKEPLEINGNPSIMKCISILQQKYGIRYNGYDSMDFDSFSYTLHGIPALTINTFDSMKHIYHTDLDNGLGFDRKIMDKTVDLILDLIECVENIPPKYSAIIDYLKNIFGEKIPLETKIVISKLESLGEKIGDENKRIRLVTKRFTSTAYILGLKPYFRNDILGDLIAMKELIETIEEYIDDVVELKNYDKTLVYISPTRYNLEEIRKSMYQYLANRSREIDNEINKILASEIITRT